MEASNVLFQVHVMNADFFEISVIVMNFNVTLGCYWEIALADLMTFREVGIEIRLSEEQRFRPDAAVESEAGQDSLLHDLMIEARQCPRQSHADRANVRIRGRVRVR